MLTKPSKPKVTPFGIADILKNESNEIDSTKCMPGEKRGFRSLDSSKNETPGKKFKWDKTLEKLRDLQDTEHMKSSFLSAKYAERKELPVLTLSPGTRARDYLSTGSYGFRNYDLSCKKEFNYEFLQQRKYECTHRSPKPVFPSSYYDSCQRYEDYTDYPTSAMLYVEKYRQNLRRYSDELKSPLPVRDLSKKMQLHDYSHENMFNPRSIRPSYSPVTPTSPTHFRKFAAVSPLSRNESFDKYDSDEDATSKISNDEGDFFILSYPIFFFLFCFLS